MDEFQRGFPKTCKCGATVMMKTSKTAKNHGRLFHACPNGSEESKWFHTFKWTDKCMVEEIEDLIDKIDDIEGASIKLHKALGACESEIQTLEMETRFCEAVVEKEIHDFKMELRSLKNMIVKEDTEANQRLRLFEKNGKVLLQDLIELCNGQSNPIKTFSANQIIEATNNFSETNHMIRFEFMYKGTLENHLVLIKRATWKLYTSDTLQKIIRDISVSSMVSGHKNFLKLLGCCLEFEHPVLVCEYAERIPLNPETLLPLQMWIRIAKEIAIAVSYLHTPFSRSMIHMDINPSNIFLDSNGIAKLSGFCLSVSIPEGETFVKVDADRVEGTLDYLEYKYVTTGLITDCCSVEESLFEDEQNVMNLRISDRALVYIRRGDCVTLHIS
ncbi:hypothetical protein AALP_AA5G219600 [Arabis alpina]|uniref:Uncharacterized protein n=1 Tax=Arabis alpina TaxID=50452 RepID=A0A087GYN5_ARAAL|nr:hypothetical protein AALP_AA5G219600 [Arabis alpina]